MATLTICIPDDKHSRLKALAEHRQMSINKLVEELSTQALAEFDTEVRFRAFSTRGVIGKGLDLVDKLDSKLTSKD